MRPSLIRWAGSLAVVCGVRLRPMALIFASLFLMPMPQSSSKRWIADSGAHVPSQEEMRRPLLARTPATACHLDGSYPLGPDHGVMVVKDAHDRILMPPDAASEQGDEARPLLPRFKDCGPPVTAAVSDDAHRFPEAINAVSPPARLPADPCHTGTHIWGHLNKAR
jgi:hypothetical protein